MNQALLIGALLISASAFQQAHACSHRGNLSKSYCDENKDLVADTPSKTVTPPRLMMAASAVENADVGFKTYFPLTKYLSSCLKREVLLYPPARTGNILEGMRTGVIHIAQFTTGNTILAVNNVGAIPFASKGFSKTGQRKTYRLLLVVRSGSPYKEAADLKGKIVAHAGPTSNSGNQTPRALFPDLGLVPDRDYQVMYSGKHEASIDALKDGKVEAAAIASDILERAIAKGEVERDTFRSLYESTDFPTESFALSHALSPQLAAEIKKCFFSFDFPPSMSKLLEDTDRFYPTNYNKDWMLVRLMARMAGNDFGEEAYRKVLADK